MNKKIYSTPTTSIVRGSELMQDMPPVNFGSGTLNGDNEGEVHRSVGFAIRLHRI